MTSKNLSRTLSIPQRIDRVILTSFAYLLTAVLCVGVVIAGIAILCLFGCAKMPITMASKDAPLLVTETGFQGVRVSAWDEDESSLVDLGWYSDSVLVGRTLSNFDWAKYDKQTRVRVIQFETKEVIDLELIKQTAERLPADKIVVLDKPTSYDEDKFIAIWQKLRPDLRFQFR